MYGTGAPRKTCIAAWNALKAPSRRTAVRRDGAFKAFHAAMQVFRGAPVPYIAAFEIPVVGADGGAAADRHGSLGPAQLQPQGPHDGAGDFFLDREYVLHPPVERFRP